MLPALVGRLAPTPSGHLHLGNALAFGTAWLSARSAGALLLLRIEDVDPQRSRGDVEASIREDLLWLGLHWDREAPRQRGRDYSPELAQLDTYRCVCSRAMLARTGGRYPGTCRDAGHHEGSVRWRLPEEEVVFEDRRWGRCRAHPAATFGDPVLRRRDAAWTYPLAVVADDVRDGVTEVVRGADLLEYTALQVLLWRQLAGRTPTWLHTPLLLDDSGSKLSKSRESTGVRELRAAGVSADAVWERLLPMIGLPAGPLAGAVRSFAPDLGPRGPITV